MTQDEIIRMAREAGLKYDEPPFQTKFVGTSEQLERFSALVAANEREACAKVCEEVEPCFGDRCAAAIRSRSQTRGN